MKNQKIVFAFHFLCLILTGGLLIYCSWKYSLNKTTSLVDFQTYHNTDKDIYPSFSLCFEGMNIYDKGKMNQTYGVANVESYIEFLQGRSWDDQMLNIDYDEVTIDLRHHVKSISIRINSLADEPLYTWNNNNSETSQSFDTKTESSQFEDSFPFVVSFQQAFTKCFTLDFSPERIPGIDKKLIKALKIELKNLSSLNVKMSYDTHYPSQMMRAAPLEVEWGKTNGILSGKLKAKTFWIDNVKVLRKRNTLKKPCNEAWTKDFQHIQAKLMENTNCKPPHWKDVASPICKDKESMKKTHIPPNAFRNPSFLERFLSPCDLLQTLTFTVQEVQRELNETAEMPTELLVAFNTCYYEEIVHVRAFDIESLVGNMGGYIGLFLGFAFWQIPDAMKSLCYQFKSFDKSASAIVTAPPE